MVADSFSFFPTLILLFGAATVAGSLNAIAGGGGLIGFPSLLFAGVPPIEANATNATALWFGTAASTAAYRREFSRHRKELLILSGCSVAGGWLGAQLLLHLSEHRVGELVPYLILVATVLFAISQPVSQWVRTRASGSKEHNQQRTLGLGLAQLAIATYGGFFGGGMGILMLATLGMMGISNVHTQNAFKSWLASCTNAVALSQFMLAGAIAWPQAMAMAAGALMGGYVCASYARRLNQEQVRRAIVVLGFGICTYLFVR